MGTVYKAYDPLLARIVAVKVISGQLDSQPEQRERFFREARAAAQLSHPNIITIYDLGEQDGKPFLAMEYLVGRDLDARMHAPEGMSLARKVEIAMAICQGLAHAHASGVVHRDIKPANVFITNDGAVKLLDFGLARLITSELTRSNMMLGTLNYMAPEQLRAERTDHRADIFSLGVVLYELLSGKKPFQGDSFASTMYKILQETPEPLERIDATLPPQVTTVVDRALAKAREDRYQSVLDLLRDLETAYESLRGADRRVIERVESTLASTPSPRPPSGSHPDAAPTMADVTVPMVYGPGPPRTPTPFETPAPASSGTGTAPVPGRRPVVAAAALAIIGLSLAGLLYFVRADRANPIEPEAGAPGAARVVPTPEPAPVPPPAPAPEAALPDGSAGRSTTTDAPAPAATDRAEPDPRQANAARAARMMREAQSLFDARRYEDAERAAGQVLTLDRTHADARALLNRIAAVESAHAARSRRAMDEARRAAVEADAAELVPQLFESAERQAESARAAESERRFTAAAARFDAAAALYSSAATAAVRDAETRAARAREDEARRLQQEEAARRQRDEESRRAQEAAALRAPSAPAPAPPPPAAPAAEELIADVVARYVRALEGRDIGALRAIWPGLSGAAQSAIENDFANARAISVSFSDPRIDVRGTSATVTGTRRYGLQTRDGQQLRSETRTTLTLRRTDSGWVIESIRHQPVN